jgi:hypothetical protein
MIRSSIAQLFIFYKHAAPPGLNTAVLQYAYCINLLHYPCRLSQRYNNFLVMKNIFITKLAAFAVLSHFLGRLVIAYAKVPCNFRHTRKTLIIVYKNTSIFKLNYFKTEHRRHRLRCSYYCQRHHLPMEGF